MIYDHHRDMEEIRDDLLRDEGERRMDPREEYHLLRERIEKMDDEERSLFYQKNREIIIMIIFRMRLDDLCGKDRIRRSQRISPENLEMIDLIKKMKEEK